MDGGRIIAEGPPEVIAETPISATGQYLKPLLERAVRPELVEGRSSPAKAGAQSNKDSPAKKKPRRKAAASDGDEFPDLIAAK